MILYTAYTYLEPLTDRVYRFVLLFWGLKFLSFLKEGQFQSKQGSVGFEVYMGQHFMVVVPANCLLFRAAVGLGTAPTTDLGLNFIDPN